MTDRCTGHCCKAFTLPYTPQSLRALVEKEKDIVRSEARELESMLVYLGEFEPREAEIRFGIPISKPKHFWTCRNHDRATGDCKIYDTRPRMCSDYPYGKGCDYFDCTSVAAQQLVPVESLVRTM